MPRSRRERRERTRDWQHIQQYTLWPEHKAYLGKWAVSAVPGEPR